MMKLHKCRVRILTLIKIIIITAVLVITGSYICCEKIYCSNRASYGTLKIVCMFEGDNNEYVSDNIMSNVAFNNFKNKKCSIKIISSKDACSVEYCISDRELSEGELSGEKINWNDYAKGMKVIIDDERKFIVYAREKVNDGNYRYVCTDGYCMDYTLPDVGVVVCDSKGANGYYNKPVRLKAKTYDEISGISNVKYVVNNGNESLIREVTGEYFDIDKEGDNVEIYIIAEDNAGNVRMSDKVTLKIYLKTPSLKVYSHSNNDSMEIEIYETDGKQNFVIDNIEQKLKLDIVAVDYYGNGVDFDYPEITWSRDADNIYHGNIRFVTNANYTVCAEYDNKKNEKLCDKTEFTIDDEPPDEELVTVMLYAYDKNNNRIRNISARGFCNEKKFRAYTNGYYELEIKNSEKSDCVSGVDSVGNAGVCYYISDRNLSVDNLENISDWTEYTSGFKVRIDKSIFKIYVRLTDQMGNISYASSEGFAIDTIPPQIEKPHIITKPYAPGIYNRDVKMKVLSSDREKNSSGKDIAQYMIKCNGKVTRRWTKFNDIINIPAENNNEDVRVYIKVSDRAGNISTAKSEKITIDSIKPKIKVEFDNNNAGNISKENQGYYNDNRNARVTIIEDENGFDEKKALSEFEIYYRKNSNDEYSYVSPDSMVTEDWKHEGITHTVNIEFVNEGTYKFILQYRDKAGNINDKVNYGESATPQFFTIDKTMPEVSVNVSPHKWSFTDYNSENIIEKFSKDNLGFGIIFADEISGIKEVSYYATHFKQVLKMEDLAKIDDCKWKNYYKGFYENSNGFVNVYVRVTDYAGNIKYVCTNGIAIDNVCPVAEIDVIDSENEHDLYNSDVDVRILVHDNEMEGTSSGISSIRYEVACNGNITQQGEIENGGILTVDSAANNSNDTVVTVFAKDGAGNSVVTKKKLKIDVTPPEIYVTYDNNAALSYDKTGYFKTGRRAKIRVIERNFSKDNIKINMSNSLNKNPHEINDWKIVGTYDENSETAYETEIEFETDGEYFFEVIASDLAGNINNRADYGNSLYPNSFIIDKTVKPAIIRFDDENAKEGKYYSSSVMAEVVIDEMNFDESNARIIIKDQDKDDTDVLPDSSSWSTEGTIHKAQVYFERDGHYTIEVIYTDKAGNVGKSSGVRELCIDKTIPEVSFSGIGDMTANKDENLKLQVDIKDYNLKCSELHLRGVIKTDGGYSMEEITPKEILLTKGIRYIYENLSEDGIYTLVCNAIDRAGNVYENISNSVKEKKQVMSFVINRRGSAFFPSEYVLKLSERYYVRRVDRDIIIEEINAGDVVNSVVRLNGDELVKDKDYTISKYSKDGEWNRYIYAISRLKMQRDGEYLITIQSEDNGGGVSYSEMKAMKISFVVDTRRPDLHVSGIKNNGIYRGNVLTLRAKVRDDGGKVKSLRAIANGKKEVFNLEGDELKKYLDNNDGIVTIDVPEMAGGIVEFICQDYAADENETGNITKLVYKNVTISDNGIILYWADKKLVCGSGLFVLIIIVVCRKIRGRKKSLD